MQKIDRRVVTVLTIVLSTSLALAAGQGAVAWHAPGSDDEPLVETTVPHLPFPTYRVPGDFDDVQAALDAAGSGDVVLLAPGRYEGPVTIPEGVALVSRFAYSREPADITATVIDGLGAHAAVSIAAGGQAPATLSGITVQNAGDGIEAHAPVHVLDCLVRDSADGIDFEDGSGGIVRGCTFESNTDDGVDVDEAVDVVIEDNVIRDNGDDGIEIRLHPYEGPTLNVVVRDNLIHGNGEDGLQLIGYDVRTDRALWIEGNTFRDNVVVGIGMMDGAETVEDLRAASLPEPIHVVENTFVNNGTGIAGGDNTVVVNNIFVGHERVAVLRVDGRSALAGNLYYRNGTDAVASNRGATGEITGSAALEPIVWHGANMLRSVRPRSTDVVEVAALAP